MTAFLFCPDTEGGAHSLWITCAVRADLLIAEADFEGFVMYTSRERLFNKQIIQRTVQFVLMVRVASTVTVCACVCGCTGLGRLQLQPTLVRLESGRGR